MKKPSRKIRFTDNDKKSTIAHLKLPGNILAPPKFLIHNTKLYKYTGSGLGVEVTNFYRELDSYVFTKEKRNVK
jgi:hypothetical protein